MKGEEMASHKFKEGDFVRNKLDSRRGIIVSRLPVQDQNKNQNTQYMQYEVRFEGMRLITVKEFEIKQM